MLVIKIAMFSFYVFSFSNTSPASHLKSKPGKPKKEDVSFKVSLSNMKFKKSFEKVKSEQKSFSLEALGKAFKYLDKNYLNLQGENLCLSSSNKKNKKLIRNLNCLIVADYNKDKNTPRLLYINPLTGESELFYTAHGKGSHNSDEIETGTLAKRFSNIEGSNMTSLGFYLTDHLYNSYKDTFGEGKGNGLKLDGLECTNNNARKRYIVMHTAKYVPSMKDKVKKVGNSEGCVTLPRTRRDILKKCEGGALVYAHHRKLN